MIELGDSVYERLGRYSEEIEKLEGKEMLDYITWLTFFNHTENPEFKIEIDYKTKPEDIKVGKRFCFILGTVSEELGEYSELKKPHTTLYRSIGNFGSLIVVLFGLMYGMWGFVAGKVRIIDGGKREVVYKKDVFDYERRDVVK